MLYCYHNNHILYFIDIQKTYSIITNTKIIYSRIFLINMFKLLFLGVLFSISVALFENSYLIKHANKLQDFRDILESEFVSLVYFYSD